MSGVIVATQKFVCMSTSFDVPITFIDGTVTKNVLCPGRYQIKGCETDSLNFNNRINNVQSIILNTVEDSPECFDANGVRQENIDGCQQGFPKFLSMEIGTHIDVGDGQPSVIPGRNPATYLTQMIDSCTSLVEFLKLHFIGCTSVTATGVVKPLSIEFWCHSILWTPNQPYHPINAKLRIAQSSRRNRKKLFQAKQYKNSRGDTP